MFTATYEECKSIWINYLRYNPGLKFSSTEFVYRAMNKLGKQVKEGDEMKQIRKYYKRFKQEYKEKGIA